MWVMDVSREIPLTPAQRQALAQLLVAALSEIGELCRLPALAYWRQALAAAEAQPGALSPLLLGQCRRELRDDLAQAHRARRLSQGCESLPPALAAGRVQPARLLCHLDRIDGTATQWGTFATAAAQALALALPDKPWALALLQAQLPWYRPWPEPEDGP